MREGILIQKTDSPRTRQSIASDLRELGLKEGMTVIIHSSLSSLGWVNGAAVAVIQALMDVVTPRGTIVMPTHSGEYSDPTLWCNPPVPEEWCDLIRETMPAFDPEITPTRGMGIIPEVFRKWPGTRRSDHPAVSFAAWGQYSEIITTHQPLDYPMGEGSPLSCLYDLDAFVLLLGVGFTNNTSFHLAEYRVEKRKETEAGAPVINNNQRVWAVYKDIELDSDLFADIGRDFSGAGQVSCGRVGSAKTLFFKQREAVDFALKWLNQTEEKP